MARRCEKCGQEIPFGVSELLDVLGRITAWDVPTLDSGEWSRNAVVGSPVDDELTTVWLDPEAECQVQVQHEDGTVSLFSIKEV